MIKNYVKISLQDNSISKMNVTVTSRSFVLHYPCEDTSKCTPYVLDIKPGKYRFECWGSRGGQSHDSIPGYGGYVSGQIKIRKDTRFFVYIGATGYFNAINSSYPPGVATSGGATDVRIKTSDNWWDISSLISRIMVAGGGGGSEWEQSRGGHGGGLHGGSSLSSTRNVSEELIVCEGASQTSGSKCPIIENHQPIPGIFGRSIDPLMVTSIKDPGGMGGGGYYGGTSYPFAFAGSGGSSFISGHEGCNAVKYNDDNTIMHTGQSIHYSGINFTKTVMIQGNNAMPIPTSKNVGFHYDYGAFRITLLESPTKRQKSRHFYLPFFCF